MKAMILAAGRGNRLRPLTDTTPKPLIDLGGRPFISYHLENLANAGFKEVIINIAHLPELFSQKLGGGEDYGIEIQYVAEPMGALETGGGIYNVLDKLGPDPFLVVNAKVYTDYDFSNLPKKIDRLAHLVLADHPRIHKPDFGLENGLVINQSENMHTFAGVGIYKPELFADCEGGSFPLGPLLRKAVDQQQVTGEYYRGKWFTLVTNEDLEFVRDYVSKSDK